MLSCKGVSGSVECEAMSIFSQKFKIVGLGIDENDSKTFRLFPLKLDNTAWMHHTFMDSNRQVSLSLSPFANDGLRIRDQACFEKLSGLFKSGVSSVKSVPLEKNGLKSGKVNIFGEVFLFDRTLSKKQSTRRV